MQCASLWDQETSANRINPVQFAEFAEAAQTAEPAFTTLINNLYRGTQGHVVKEGLGHFARHTNAAVRSRVTRQITFVHANAPGDSHEEWHWGTLEDRTWRFWVFSEFDLFLNDISCRVHIIAV